MYDRWHHLSTANHLQILNFLLLYPNMILKWFTQVVQYYNIQNTEEYQASDNKHYLDYIVTYWYLLMPTISIQIVIMVIVVVVVVWLLVWVWYRHEPATYCILYALLVGDYQFGDLVFRGVWVYYVYLCYLFSLFSLIVLVCFNLAYHCQVEQL